MRVEREGRFKKSPGGENQGQVFKYSGMERIMDLEKAIVISSLGIELQYYWRGGGRESCPGVGYFLQKGNCNPRERKAVHHRVIQPFHEGKTHVEKGGKRFQGRGGEPYFMASVTPFAEIGIKKPYKRKNLLFWWEKKKGEYRENCGGEQRGKKGEKSKRKGCGPYTSITKREQPKDKKKNKDRNSLCLETHGPQ